MTKYYPELRADIRGFEAYSRILRDEERRCRSLRRRVRLRSTRVDAVRPTARACQLAYAFLRGKRYADVEPTACTAPRWSEVRSYISRNGRINDNGDDEMVLLVERITGLDLWIAEAEKLIDVNQQLRRLVKAVRADAKARKQREGQDVSTEPSGGSVLGGLGSDSPGGA